MVIGGTMDPNRSQPAWILDRYAALVIIYSYVKEELTKRRTYHAAISRQ